MNDDEYYQFATRAKACDSKRDGCRFDFHSEEFNISYFHFTALVTRQSANSGENKVSEQ